MSKSKNLRNLILAIFFCLTVPIIFVRICETKENSKYELYEIVDVKKYQFYCEVKYKSFDGSLFESAYFTTVIDSSCKYSIKQKIK